MGVYNEYFMVLSKVLFYLLQDGCIHTVDIVAILGFGLEVHERGLMVLRILGCRFEVHISGLMVGSEVDLEVYVRSLRDAPLLAELSLRLQQLFLGVKVGPSLRADQGRPQQMRCRKAPLTPFPHHPC